MITQEQRLRLHKNWVWISRAGLLPEDKVTSVMEISQTHNTMMVGDGINDAPAMKAATIGVAMGSGTDVAFRNRRRSINPLIV